MKCLNCNAEINITGGMFQLPIFDMKSNRYLKKRVVVVECPDRSCAQLIGIQKAVLREIKKKITVLDSAQHKGKSSRI